MKVCLKHQIAAILLASGSTHAFMAGTRVPSRGKVINTPLLNALPEKVEVCGFKDCRRAGGGARLENLINTVLEENNLVDTIKVEGCECQGECGYGPNLLVDGKMVNRVKGKDAVVKALRIDGVESA